MNFIEAIRTHIGEEAVVRFDELLDNVSVGFDMDENMYLYKHRYKNIFEFIGMTNKNKPFQIIYMSDVWHLSVGLDYDIFEKQMGIEPDHITNCIDFNY